MILLAPNGKPSNLNPEQYKLVRTPEFKAWFGFWDLYAYGKAKNYYEPSVKKIAKELKEEKLSAINEAVNFLSKQVTENDVLIPMPSRYGIATDTRKLAQKISEKTGAKLFDCLVGKKRKSVYEMKKNNQDLSNFDFNFQINCEIPKAKNYFIVDNVIGTGVTMKNALQNVIKNVGTNVSPLVFAIDLNNISKVVDENGEPLVVYHGTPDARFSVFDKNKFHTRSKSPNSKGFFFTPSKDYARAYSESSNNKWREKAKEVLGYYPVTIEARPYAKEIPCFLNIKNPKYSEDSLLHTIKSIKINDGLIVYYLNKNEIFEIAVFKPNQIKLADGTNTTFDGRNPDIRFSHGGEVNMESLSEESLKVINENYNDAFGFYDLDWNKESERENFKEWLNNFYKKQFNKNLDEAIKKIESDIELIKKRKIVELKLKAFEELIIPTLGNEVLSPKLSVFEEMVLMNPSATIESIEKGFQEAKNIIDEDGSINESKITPSNLFQDDYINLPAFERFVKLNPEYTGVFNDWKKLFDEDIQLTLKDTYAYRYPTLQQLEKLHLELTSLNNKKTTKRSYSIGGKTSIFNSIEKNNNSITFRGDNGLIAQITIEDSFIDTKGFSLPYKYAEIYNIKAPIDENKLFARIEKKGYGSKMLHELIEFCKQNKIPYIGSTSLNEKSYALLYKFEKLGLLEPKEKGLHKRTILWKIN